MSAIKKICGTHRGNTEDGTSCFVLGRVFSDVSTDRISFIFWVKKFKKICREETLPVLYTTNGIESYRSGFKLSGKVLIKTKSKSKHPSHF